MPERFAAGFRAPAARERGAARADTDAPPGLRERTMIELMYASGLRLSERVRLKTV